MFASEGEIGEMALSSLSDLIDGISQMDDQSKFSVIVLGTKLGVAGDGVINDIEKSLIDDIFGRIWRGPMTDIYEVVGEEIDDNDYELVQLLTQMGNSIAMPFLHFVLSFAYIDEVFEDEIAEKLDGLFGLNLMASFFYSGLESVPAPQIKLTGLEAEIVEWFQKENEMKPLKDIQTHFSSRSRSEVKAALDSL